MQKSVLVRDTEIRVTDILEKIAKGYSYKQILTELPQLNVGDIMMAAQISFEILNDLVVEGSDHIRLEGRLTLTNGKYVNLTKLRKEHPRAYIKWEPAEDDNLKRLHQQGKRINELSEILMRQPGAIMARLQFLGLIRDRQAV
ncbi:MAG: DUF433 domain-containing protein [Candidatus Zixiibacteriota bacterium]